MSDLLDVQRSAEALSVKERKGLIAHLIETLPGAPLGPADDEVSWREADLESGKVRALSHDEFVEQSGRG
jgi:hypothetical protein